MPQTIEMLHLRMNLRESVLSVHYFVLPGTISISSFKLEGPTLFA